MMVLATAPVTPAWTPITALIMTVCNVLALLVARSVVTIPKDSTVLTLPIPGMTLTLPELLAAASFGHLVGAGVILGLSRLGTI